MAHVELGAGLQHNLNRRGTGVLGHRLRVDRAGKPNRTAHLQPVGANPGQAHLARSGRLDRPLGIPRAALEVRIGEDGQPAQIRVAAFTGIGPAQRIGAAALVDHPQHAPAQIRGDVEAQRGVLQRDHAVRPHAGGELVFVELQVAALVKLCDPEAAHFGQERLEAASQAVEIGRLVPVAAHDEPPGASEINVIERQPGLAHAEAHGVALGRRLRLAEQLAGAREKISAQVGRARLKVNPEVMAKARRRRAHLPVQQVEVGAHGPGRAAVAGLQELVDVAVHVGLDVPQQPRHYVGAQLGHLAPAAGRISALHEQADRPVPAVHRDVGRQLVEIGERQQVVREVGVVVPDVELAGDLRPGLEVLHEVGVAVALFVRVSLAGSDGAEANPHVRPRPRLRRRRLGVLVGQRVDELVGMLLLDLLRQRVDEAQQRAGVRAAFFLLDAAAAVALAPAGPVVLRHRQDGRLGMLADPAEHRLNR